MLVEGSPRISRVTASVIPGQSITVVRNSPGGPRPVSEAGERVLWFDRVKMLEVGQRKGAVFTAREAANADAPVLACEGEINALALCLSPWAEPGARVVSVGAAGNMDALAGLGRNVVLFADDDWPGRKAAREAAKAIRSARAAAVFADCRALDHKFRQLIIRIAGTKLNVHQKQLRRTPKTIEARHLEMVACN